MINDEYRRTRIFQKADQAYELVKIFIFLFWMPLFIGIFFLLQ